MKVDIETYNKVMEAWILQQPEAQELIKDQLATITAAMRDDPVAMLRAAVAVREQLARLARDPAVLRPIILPLMTRFHTACRAAGVEVDGLSAEELDVLAGGRGAAS